MIETLETTSEPAGAESSESEATTGVHGRRTKPELLAPAGDRTCLIAAVENGADAVYFGLQRHNARIRADNFDGADLPEVMALLHRRGVKGYTTLNTLAFPGELADLEATVRDLATAGVDAVIVQDLGLARLIHAITPDLEIHASTQMSITSEEGVALARELGCTRVILARELALAEIGRIRRAIDFPVEVFVHGALCVAYSGQCLTSEALGGRSANRGECAQACRMPYEIVCDGRLVDLDNIQYLLSPQDLAAYDLIPQLIELGVASLKIEGRLKTAEYVANITRHYREAIDAAWAGRPVAFTPRDVQEMQLSFSRGFSHGFLDGNNHKVLVRGDYAKKRGILLGVVESITSAGVRLTRVGAGQAGRWPGLRRRRSDRPPRARGPRLRGHLASIGHEHVGSSDDDAEFTGRVELRFGREAIDLRELEVGQQVWKTDDPELTRRLRRSFEGPPNRKVMLDLEVVAVAGEPLRITATTAGGPASRGPIGRGARRRPSRAPRTWTCSERSSAGWEGRSIELARPRGHDRGPADGADEPAQPPAPRAGRAARRSRGHRAGPRRSRRSRSCRALLEPITGRTRSSSGRRSRRPARAGRAIGPMSAHRPDRGGPASSASRRSTPITRTSSNTPRPSRRSAEQRRRGDLSGDPAHREAGRSQSLRLPGQARGRRHPGAQRRRHAVLLGARHSVRGGLLAQRGQSAHRRALEEPRGRPRDGLLRPERRPALATARHDAVRRGSRS